MLKLPIFEHFLHVGNLKPKVKWFFKRKLQLKLFLLNWAPGAGEAAAGDRRQGEGREAEGRIRAAHARDEGGDGGQAG